MPRLGKKKIIDRNVYELAIDRIHRAYDRFDTVAVMFSVGKDSTACLMLTILMKRRYHMTLKNMSGGFLKSLWLICIGGACLYVTETLAL